MHFPAIKYTVGFCIIPYGILKNNTRSQNIKAYVVL